MLFRSSTATLSGTGSDRSLTTDIVGSYRATLVVKSAAGTDSAPCSTSLSAEADLRISLTWEHAGDDMDLHLVRPDGELDSSDDCYYSNCTYGGLDWGRRGYEADDPSLDLDDIPGTGPEIITLEEPEDGTFTVYVQDYPGSVYEGSDAVRVTVELGGLPAATRTLDIDEENSYTPFFTITYPTLVITEP